MTLSKLLRHEKTAAGVYGSQTFNAPGNFATPYGKTTVYITGRGESGSAPTYPYVNTNATNYPYVSGNPAAYPYANTNAVTYPVATYNTQPGTANYNFVAATYNTLPGNAIYTYVAATYNTTGGNANYSYVAATYNTTGGNANYSYVAAYNYASGNNATTYPYVSTNPTYMFGTIEIIADLKAGPNYSSWGPSTSQPASNNSALPYHNYTVDGYTLGTANYSVSPGSANYTHVNAAYPYVSTNALAYPLATPASYPYVSTNAFAYPLATNASYPYSYSNATTYPLATNATYPYANTNAVTYPAATYNTQPGTANYNYVASTLVYSTLPGTANYNTVSGAVGADQTVAGVLFPGGAIASLAPVVPSTVTSLEYTPSGYSVVVPAGGYITLANVQ